MLVDYTFDKVNMGQESKMVWERDVWMCEMQCPWQVSQGQGHKLPNADAILKVPGLRNNTWTWTDWKLQALLTLVHRCLDNLWDKPMTKLKQ